MDAIVITGPGKLEIQSVEPRSRTLRPQEVSVRVERLSLCGSDYALYSGTYGGPKRYPIRFGHEWSGVVVDRGADVALEVGDTVTGDCSMWCGSCSNCSHDKNTCEHIEKFGITRDGFSQQVVVVDRRYLYANVHALPLDVLALTEPFAVALHAVHRWRRIPEEPANGTTLIIGGGCLGMAVYLLLTKYLHWRRVEVYEPSSVKCELLQGLFPAARIRADLETSEKHERRDYEGIYGRAAFPLVFETSSAAESLQTALSVCAVGGTVVTLGLHALIPRFDSSSIVLKSLSVVGSIGGTGEFEEVMAFLGGNIEPVRRLISACFDYKDVDAAFNAGSRRQVQLKVQLSFSNQGRS